MQVGTIIMDNDTTTIARARTEVNPALKKQCDKNHTLKQFTNKLYDLKKCKNYKELNSKTKVTFQSASDTVSAKINMTWMV